MPYCASSAGFTFFLEGGGGVSRRHTSESSTVGMPNCASTAGFTSVDILLMMWMVSAYPLRRMISLATCARCSFASIAITHLAPTEAAIIERSPEPAPISRTTDSGVMTRRRAAA